MSLCRAEKPMPLNSIAMIAMTPAVIRTNLESGSKASLGSGQQQKRPTTALRL